jgi:hypothetical protein
VQIKISACIIIIILLISGCASGPGLGYPAGEVDVPTRVTLFSTIAKQGRIVRQVDIGSAEIWNSLYKERFEDLLAVMRLDELQDIMDAKFLEAVSGKAKLFELEPVEVFNWDVPYAASFDTKEHSGFDFSNYKDGIPAPYILALFIEDWGYTVNRDKEKDGPFISMTIRLIEKETGRGVWKYSKTYQERIVDPLGDVNYGSIKAKQIDAVYRLLIQKAVKQIFGALGE